MSPASTTLAGAVTDYSPIQLATPWKRTVLLLLLAAVLVFGALGAAVFYVARHFRSAQTAASVDGGA